MYSTLDSNIITDDYLFNKMLVSKRISYFESAPKDRSEESYVFDDGIIKAFMSIVEYFTILEHE
jgi:hypothetical protein